MARAWLRQEVADLLPESFEPALGDGRRFERLILRALFDQGTFQLDQFLTVFLLNTPARFDTLVLEVSTVRVDTRRGRPGGIQRCTSGGERGFPGAILLRLQRRFDHRPVERSFGFGERAEEVEVLSC